MPLIEATQLVEKKIAERLPAQPGWTRQLADSALEVMNELAAERGHKVSSAPRLADARDTRLGYVELRFVADTQPK